jgi:hypothetical protein
MEMRMELTAALIPEEYTPLQRRITRPRSNLAFWRNKRALATMPEP